MKEQTSHWFIFCEKTSPAVFHKFQQRNLSLTNQECAGKGDENDTGCYSSEMCIRQALPRWVPRSDSWFRQELCQINRHPRRRVWCFLLAIPSWNGINQHDVFSCVDVPQQREDQIQSLRWNKNKMSLWPSWFAKEIHVLGVAETETGGDYTGGCQPRLTEIGWGIQGHWF